MDTAAPAAAAHATPECPLLAAGHFKLDLVSTTDTSDLLALCLNSVKVKLYSTCQVPHVTDAWLRHGPPCCCPELGAARWHIPGFSRHQLGAACTGTCCCTPSARRCHHSNLPAPRPPTRSALRPLARPQVALEPLNSAGIWVPAVWTGNGAETFENYLECPTKTGTIMSPESISSANVRTAIVKAFEGHVYGFSGTTPKNPTTLNAATPIVYANGRVTITRATGAVLVYAITEVHSQAATALCPARHRCLSACPPVRLPAWPLAIRHVPALISRDVRCTCSTHAENNFCSPGQHCHQIYDVLQRAARQHQPVPR